MKLGMITYNVARDWDLETLIHQVKAAGWAGVELRTEHAHGVETTLSKPERKVVQQRFEDSGIELWGFGTVCEFHSADSNVVKANLESCKRWCELAEDVGARGVKVRPNGLPKEVEESKTLEQIGRSLAACGKAAAAHGVEIWLEVHGSQTAHPPRIRTILDHVNHPSVGACWNCNREDLLDGSIGPYFELLQKDLKSCHINDLWSDYPYAELFTLLNAMNYDRYTLCEVGTPFHPEEGLAFMKCYGALWGEMQG